MSSFNLATLFKVLRFVLQPLRWSNFSEHSLARQFVVGHLIVTMCYENIVVVQKKQHVYCS